MRRSVVIFLGASGCILATLAIVGILLTRGQGSPRFVPRPGEHLVAPDLASGTACTRARALGGGAVPARYIIPKWARADRKTLHIYTPHGAFVTFVYSPGSGIPPGANAAGMRGYMENPIFDSRRFYAAGGVGMRDESGPVPLPGGGAERDVAFSLVRPNDMLSLGATWPDGNAAAKREADEVARCIIFSIKPR